MSFLERVGDWFTGFTGGIERFITRLFGASNERQIKNRVGYYREKDGTAHVVPGSLLDRINSLEPEFKKQSDEELKQTATKFRARLAAGETLDDLLPEAFAAVRESSWRALKMRHYDVQMVGGYFLHNGIIAEMVTGEGKTLVATLPAFLNALAGNVHVITVNDYLALRDMEWMGPVYMNLGLTVGAIQASMDPHERQGPYSCDITYGTNNEFGFDYLRDNMKPRKDLQVQGSLDFAIVDEIDNILIDEARTPLIISGAAHDDITKYAKADRVAKQLQKDVHFEVNEKDHTCHLNEDGIRKAEELAGVESFYTVGNMEWPHLIDNSLRAYYLYKKDVNYVVENGEIIIVDEFTGRKMEGRQWSDGLHQAVEAKEHVQIKEETQTLATITLQNYFKLYKKLAGMTGTAMTEANEFWKVYKLDVIAVPTNKPLQRINYTDLIYRTEKEKWDAIINEVREVHQSGRPILVGTVSIEKSELISDGLTRQGVKHEVLNAKYHEREAEIVAQAGRKNAVTIATNMAGRGTDIVLGGNPEHMAWDELKKKYESRLDVTKAEWDETTRRIAEREGMDKEGREVAELGGLHVIGSERHDSRRIDLQLRGRAGRQGDPGSSRFFLSMDDDLMRKFIPEWMKGMLSKLGMQEGEAIESKMVQKRVEGAQKKQEERHFDSRKNLLEYDEVMDDQRKKVYSYRQDILDGANCRDLIREMIDRQVELGASEFLDPNYSLQAMAEWCRSELSVQVDGPSLRGMSKEQMIEYLVPEAVSAAESDLMQQIDTDLPEGEDTSEWSWQALSKFINARWGLNTNDRELKKIGRENLFQEIIPRINKWAENFDYSPLDEFLQDDYAMQGLCAWLNYQFTLEMEPSEFQQLELDEALDLINRKVDALYREKEVEFPVDFGMHEFLDDKTQSERHGRELLVKWAGDRFNADLSEDALKGKSREEVHNLLVDHSRRFLGDRVDGEPVQKIDDFLERLYGADPESAGNGHLAESNGHPGQNGTADRAEVLKQLTQWAGDEFRAELAPEDFEKLPRNEARYRLLAEYEGRFRPELGMAERSLLLEILDTAWKDHLYYMDKVKDTIGLEGYAGKDPKVEYKKEGRRAFNAMWDSLGQQVTSAVFRMEIQSEEFSGAMWDISSAVHEEYREQMPGDDGSQYDPNMPAVETIRNRGPKVGRNDPCPCGSGKKYKKCCGKAA